MRPRQNKFEKARDAMREQIQKACVCEKENGVARLNEINGMRKRDENERERRDRERLMNF